MKKIILILIFISIVQFFSKEMIVLEGSFNVPKFCDSEYIENDIIDIFKKDDLKKLATIISKEMAFSFSGHDNVYTFKNIEKELKGHEFTKLLFDEAYLKERFRHQPSPYTFKYIMTEVFLKNKDKVFGWDNEYPYYDKQRKKKYNNITIGLNYKGYSYSMQIYCSGKDYYIYRFDISFE